MSYLHNSRKKAIKHYLDGKKNGKDFITVNGEKSIYTKVDGQWKLQKYEG